MTLKQDELFNESAGLGSQLRVIPNNIQPKNFASGAGVIPKLGLVSFNESTGFWEAFDADAGTDQVNAVTADGTPATAGTFTLTVGGETTSPIAFDADAADVQAALEGLQGIDAGDVAGVDSVGTDLGDAGHVVTLTFGGKLKGTPLVVTADMSGLTGNAHVLSEPTPGVAGQAVNEAQGFAWPEAITLDAADEIKRTVMLGGRVHAADVPLNGQTQGAVDAALVSLRTKNFIIEGLEAYGT